MSRTRRYWNSLAAMHVLRVLPLDWFLALTRARHCLAFTLVVAIFLMLGIVSLPTAMMIYVIGVTTDNIKYSSSTSITCTLTSLASSTTAGRQCTVVDNTSNLYDDVYVTIGVATNASTPASTKSCYVYFSGTEDLTNYDQDDAAPGATDAAYTVNSASNLKGPGVISCPTASKTYRRTFPLAVFFGGLVPPKWLFVVTNDTNNNLGTTAIGCSYTGITYTNT